MPTYHDPHQLLSTFQQALSNSMRPLGVFLGAGCPMAVRVAGEPLIPDVAGVTAVTKTALTGQSGLADLFARVEANLVADGVVAPTVESILGHIRGLRAVSGTSEVRGFSVQTIDQLDTAICSEIVKCVDKGLPDSTSPYHELASWIDAVTGSHPIELFTTNYDLLMEQALEERRVPYFDGFPGGREPLFDLRAMEEDRLPVRWARLWKLHGSTNWYQRTGGGVYRKASQTPGHDRRVIYPSHLKYEESRRMPYLAMIDRLRAFLRKPSAVLVVTGFSFRDEHINEALVQGLEANPTAACFAFVFGPMTQYAEAVALGKRQANLVVSASDAAVVSGTQGRWPEREASAIDASELSISWTPVDPANPTAAMQASLGLGDFRQLAGLLTRLAGQARGS